MSLDHWGLRSPWILSRRLPPVITWKYKGLNPLFVTLHHTLHSIMWHFFLYYSVLPLAISYVSILLRVTISSYFSLHISYLIDPTPTVLLYILGLLLPLLLRSLHLVTIYSPLWHRFVTFLPSEHFSVFFFSNSRPFTYYLIFPVSPLEPARSVINVK
jgi:hypothetical protein